MASPDLALAGGLDALKDTFHLRHAGVGLALLAEMPVDLFVLLQQLLPCLRSKSLFFLKKNKYKNRKMSIRPSKWLTGEEEEMRHLRVSKKTTQVGGKINCTRQMITSCNKRIFWFARNVSTQNERRRDGT